MYQKQIVGTRKNRLHENITSFHLKIVDFPAVKKKNLLHRQVNIKH